MNDNKLMNRAADNIRILAALPMNIHTLVYLVVLTLP